MHNRCGTISIDKTAVTAAIQDYLIAALEAETETLLSIMRREIQATTHGEGPGKPEWRDQLAVELREVYRVVTDEAIEFGVGLPHMSYADAGHKFIRAMLIAHGSGSQAAGGSPIQSRPGELVWDDDLRDFQPSTAMTRYLLPEAFNQIGNDFIANAMRIMDAHFKAMLESAAGRLPKGLFADNTIATKE